MSKSNGKKEHKKLTKKEIKAQNHLKLMEGKKRESQGTTFQQQGQPQGQQQVPQKKAA